MVLAGITIDYRLWRMKGDCYGAAVKENSRSKRIFSLGTAREQASDNNMKICCFSRTEFIIACLQSAVRKSLIFERAAFPSKSILPLSLPYFYLKLFNFFPKVFVQLARCFNISRKLFFGKPAVSAFLCNFQRIYHKPITENICGSVGEGHNKTERRIAVVPRKDIKART